MSKEQLSVVDRDAATYTEICSCPYDYRKGDDYIYQKEKKKKIVSPVLGVIKIDGMYFLQRLASAPLSFQRL